MTVELRWLDNAGIELATSSTRLWFDPFWPTDEDAEHDIGTRPPDFAVFTHGHQGHFRNAGRILAAGRTRLVASAPLLQFARENLSAPAGIEVEPGTAVSLGDVTIRPVPVTHPHVIPDLDVGSAPPEPNLAYLVDTGGSTFFHVGDLDLDPATELELSRLPDCDVAALPFWGPRMAWTLDEGIETLIRSASLLRARVVIPGYHFHGDQEPTRRLIEAAASRLPGCRILQLIPGESVSVD